MKIRCENLDFSYGQHEILKNLNSEFSSGMHVWIKGRSGSGKSTFLKLIAGLLKPQRGHLWIENEAIDRLDPEALLKFRRENLGFVHQENHAIEHWTVQQNLELFTEKTDQWRGALNKVGLEHLPAHQKISELSGGERQRLNIARLVLQKPKIALVDEPTSHLDDESTEKILNYMETELNSSTILLVSHDLRLGSRNYLVHQFRGRP